MADAVTGRLWQPHLPARTEPAEDGQVRLLSPGVGYWRRAPAQGSLVVPGGDVGEFEVLGVVHRLIAPASARGLVVELAQRRRGRIPVGYGDPLAVLDPSAAGDVAAGADAAAGGTDEAGLAFRASSSGRFYSRPAPSKPPFVEPGQIVEKGQPVGLIEVMKTYSRLLYGGDDLPARARIAAVRPADGDDLAAGDVILELEPA